MHDHLAKRLQAVQQREAQELSAAAARLEEAQRHAAAVLEQSARQPKRHVMPSRQIVIPLASVRAAVFALLGLCILVSSGIFAYQKVAKARRAATASAAQEAISTPTRKKAPSEKLRLVKAAKPKKPANKPSAADNAAATTLATVANSTPAKSAPPAVTPIATSKPIIHGPASDEPTSGSHDPESDELDRDDVVDSSKPSTPAVTGNADREHAEMRELFDRAEETANETSAAKNGARSAAALDRVYGLFEDRPRAGSSGAQRQGTPAALVLAQAAEATASPAARGLADDGTRIAFAFHKAPWPHVLSRFAAKIDKQLQMPVEPKGTLTYCDPRPCSTPQAIEILNDFLQADGFALGVEGDKLCVVQTSTNRGTSIAVVPGAGAAQQAQASRTASADAGGMRIVPGPLNAVAAGESQPAQPGAPNAETDPGLEAARRDLERGLLGAAQHKARQAQRDERTYGVLADRPETILQDVDRTLERQNPLAAIDSKMMSFDFRNAPWETVIQSFAEYTGLQLKMPQAPQGTLNYRDMRQYTPSQTLAILNGFLRRTGYQMTVEGSTLVVLPSGAQRANMPTR